MRIAFFTRSDVLFKQVNSAFEEKRISCTRFDNELFLIRFLQRDSVNLVIFDATHTHKPALATLKWRTCHFRTDLPVMMIGRSWDCQTVIEALDAGVDEVVIGATNFDEIVPRACRSIARSRGTILVNQLNVAGYILDRATSSASFSGRRVMLTAREFSLAWLLFLHAGNVMSREQLANSVWGKDIDLASRTLEQHIYKLRSKLSLDKQDGPYLKTVYSLGYVLNAPSENQFESYSTFDSVAA